MLKHKMEKPDVRKPRQSLNTQRTKELKERGPLLGKPSENARSSVPEKPK